jgi:TonB family protein
MFDFAISKNQQPRPTRRLFASWSVSCAVHILLLFLLIQYPELLRGGMYHRFRPVSALANLFSPQTQDDETKDWRTVAVIKTPLIQPSAATLKKYMKDWNAKNSSLPPINLRWGDEQKKALENLPPMPKVQQEPKAAVVLPPANDATPAGSPAGNTTQSSPGSSAIGQVDPNTGRKGPVGLPPPGPPGKTDTASTNPPASIPDGVKPPSNVAPPSKENMKVFDNEQQAIRSPDSGFFGVDAKGFPLGEYANLIKERIKGNWLIPSHLKNSQGHTTIVFYINKDGRYSGARIEASASSGNNALDIAALKAIMDSNPFPPLPKGYPGDHLGAKFVLSYNEP